MALVGPRLSHATRRMAGWLVRADTIHRAGRWRRLVWAGAAVVVGGLAWLDAAPAVGQPPQAVSPRRLVDRFDFEDRNDQGVKLGRGLALPPAWYATGRDPHSRDPNFLRLPLHERLARMPGFSSHNTVHYSALGQGAASDYSLYLGLNEGNAGAFLQVGTLPAVAGSDYLVTARVRTRGLEHAAARVRTYFIDANGRRIELSVRQTPRLRTQDAWADIDLKLPGEFAEAAYIGVEVELIQPTPDPLNPLGNHQVVLTDVHGEAWFDDVAVWQLPHVQIQSSSPVNIQRGSGPPVWDIAVRDLVGGSLTSQLTLYDVAGQVVAQERRPMGWGEPSTWRWSPALPAYGWYLAELAVLESASGAGARPWVDRHSAAATPPATGSHPPAAGPTVVATAYNAVLWLPEGTGVRGADAERFALVAQGMAERHLRLLPQLVRATGLGGVVISAWDRETTLGKLDLRLETLQSVVGPLRSDEKRVELSFHPIPEELEHTRGVQGPHAAAVFEAPESVWMPFLQPILVRQGQRVNTWHLGSAEDPAAAPRPQLPATVARLYEAMRQWTPAPVIGLPWRLDQPVRPDLTQPQVSYAIQWPAAFTPGRLEEQLAATPDTPGLATAGQSRRLHIQPASAADVSHPQRATDLAIRMVRAWEQDATGVAVADLWTPGNQRGDTLLPDPLLGVLANVATRLAGYRAVGELNLDHSRVALIFEKQPDRPAVAGRAGTPTPPLADDPHDGMLVAWNVSASGSERRLHLKLGSAPVAYDVWGNATPLSADAEGRQTVELDESPVFITGIDSRLALFRGGFSIDEPFITSTQVPHPRTLRLSNPWPVTITGQVTLTGPAGWSLRPYRCPFSIAPGRTLELPVVMQFPIQELAGGKELTAQVEVTADRRHDVQLSVPLELGLEGVRFEASLSLEPRGDGQGKDATVACIITNTGRESLSLNAFATLPGHPRQERLIPRLEAGQSVIRRFRFPAADAALGQDDIRVGVRQTNGPAILNQSVGLRDVP